MVLHPYLLQSIGKCFIRLEIASFSLSGCIEASTETFHAMLCVRQKPAWSITWWNLVLCERSALQHKLNKPVWSEHLKMSSLEY